MVSGGGGGKHCSLRSDDRLHFQLQELLVNNVTQFNYHIYSIHSGYLVIFFLASGAEQVKNANETKRF